MAEEIYKGSDMGKKERIIITPKLLADLTAGLDPFVRVAALAPFNLPGNEALKAFNDIIEELEMAPDAPGKTEAVDAFRQLKRAYTNMTVFERESVRKGIAQAFVDQLVRAEK
jgi:hypothetical protein